MSCVPSGLASSMTITSKLTSLFFYQKKKEEESMCNLLIEQLSDFGDVKRLIKHISSALSNGNVYRNGMIGITD